MLSIVAAANDHGAEVASNMQMAFEAAIGAFLFFGFETGRQSLTEIDASLQTAAAIERQQGAD